MLTATSLAQNGLPGADRGWSRYESPNFELISDESLRDARAVLEDLELLRAVFFEAFHFREVERLPVTVYSFDSNRLFEAYAPRREGQTKKVAGLYQAHPDRAVILLRPIADRTLSRRVVFHEYVHHLFKASGEQPPLWFNEGMAELLAGIRIDRDTVTIGHPLGDRLGALQARDLLPLETLFQVGHNSKHYASNDHAGLFYAESWALVHYWRFGQHKLDKAAVDRFLRVAGSAEALRRTNIESLFQECFKMDYRAMEKQLARYVRKGRYEYGKLPRPELPDPSTYGRTELSEADARLWLAELALRMNDDPAGRAELLRRTADEPTNPRIYETLGAIEAAKKRPIAAIEFWERAEETGTTNANVSAALADSEFTQWLGDRDDQIRIPDEVVQRLRRRLIATIGADPDKESAWEMFAWLEACAEKPSVANVMQIQKHFPHLRHRGQTLIALALVRERVGAKDEAIQTLMQINAVEPSVFDLQQAEVILARLQGRSVNEVSLRTKDTAVQTGVTQLTRNLRALPSTPIPEDL